MTRVAGDTTRDERIWNTYMFWAYERALLLTGVRPSGRQPLIIEDPNNRLDEASDKALQTIIFAAFVLEYRMKRVFEVMEVKLRPNTTLGPLLKCFWTRLAAVDRLDKKGKCKPPEEWGQCEPLVKRLVRLRNMIVHADYPTINSEFPNASSAGKEACQLYNSMVEAVKLMNIGTGYDLRGRNEIDEYFESLKVHLQE